MTPLDLPGVGQDAKITILLNPREDQMWIIPATHSQLLQHLMLTFHIPTPSPGSEFRTGTYVNSKDYHQDGQLSLTKKTSSPVMVMAQGQEAYLMTGPAECTTVTRTNHPQQRRDNATKSKQTHQTENQRCQKKDG